MTDLGSTGASSSAPSVAAAPTSRLPFATLFAYAIPTSGIGFMFFMTLLYLMIFATDVLLIAPAVVALILGVSRILDAVTDPLAGYLSDRTRSSLGRRRPWLLFSALPLAVVFTMMWAPPATLEGPWLTVWMAVAIIGFYGVLTLVNVPHISWGAELSPDYHERTRVFGARLLLLNLGAFAAILCLLYVIGADEPRAVVGRVMMLVAGATALMTIASALYLKERREFVQRGPDRIVGAYTDVVKNPHARLLLIVFFIESLGGATIGVLTPYMARYVIGDVSFPLVVGTYMLAMTVTVPLWSPLARRFGKKRLWLCSMLGTAFGFGGFFFLGQGDVVQTYVLAAFLGVAAGCGNVIAPSVQSDIVDFDEHRTGERKEGGYFAAFNFIQKSAAGVTIMLTGFVLQFSGYVPNVEQTETAQLAIKSLYALFPLSCYLIGSLLFLRFSFNEAEHDVVRGELESRRRLKGD
ncbi:MAG: MFS transporter [Gammaproteobacteria bacterium]|nr:MFS transporter [Gammaproteobacteria bacterium]